MVEERREELAEGRLLGLGRVGVVPRDGRGLIADRGAEGRGTAPLRTPGAGGNTSNCIAGIEAAVSKYESLLVTPLPFGVDELPLKPSGVRVSTQFP